MNRSQRCEGDEVDLDRPVLLCRESQKMILAYVHSPRASRARSLRMREGRAYLKPALIVSDVDLPLSFSSRLILVAAADSPMKRAKIGSATLLMM